jgi:large subunit ribosomal protein L15
MFESGHIPLYRRLPQRGFSRARFQNPMAILNLEDLERHEGETVTIDSLREAGIVRRSDRQIKLLGQGEVSRKLAVTVDAVSASARQKIEAAGGSVTVPEKKTEPAESSESTEKAEATPDEQPEESKEG